MSFAKAQDLLRLAQLVASQRGGVCLENICSEFGVSHRTAQRMTEALDATFANIKFTDGEDRRRYWRMAAPLPEKLQPRQETAIEAPEIAAPLARDQARANSLDYAASIDGPPQSLWRSRVEPSIREGSIRSRSGVKWRADSQSPIRSTEHMGPPNVRFATGMAPDTPSSTSHWSTSISSEAFHSVLWLLPP